MESLWNRLGALTEPVVVATVVRVTGSAPREPGARMVVYADGRTEGTMGGGRLELRVRTESRALLAESLPHLIRTYRLNPAEDQCCGGEVDVFFERVAPAPQVLLFGAGHVGQAVAQALAPLSFRIVVVDERPDYATRERFPQAAEVHCGEPLEVLGRLKLSTETYVLIFTHSHGRDLQLLSVLVGRPLRLLGLIGSRTKWARFRAALLSRGVSQAELDRVTCPIGIGVGGKPPAEIAVSVAAQLLAVRDGLSVRVSAPEADAALRGSGLEPPATLLGAAPEAPTSLPSPLEPRSGSEKPSEREPA